MDFDTYFTHELTVYAEKFRIPHILIVRCKRDEVNEVVRHTRLRLYTSAYRNFLHKELVSGNYKEIYCEVCQKQTQAENKYGNLLCILDCHKHFKKRKIEYHDSNVLSTLFRIDCDFVILVPKGRDSHVGNYIKQLTDAAKIVGRKTEMVFWGEDEDNASSEENEECTVSIVYRTHGNFMKMCRIIQKYSTLYSVGQAVNLFAEPEKFPIVVTCKSRAQAINLVNKLDDIGCIAYITDEDNNDEDEKVSLFLPNGIPGEKLLDLSKAVIKYSCSHTSLVYCVMHLDEGATTVVCPNMSNAIHLLCALHSEDVEAYITNNFEL